MNEPYTPQLSSILENFTCTWRRQIALVGNLDFDPPLYELALVAYSAAKHIEVRLVRSLSETDALSPTFVNSELATMESELAAYITARASLFVD